MKDLVPIEWRNQRVLTTKQVAVALNCSIDLVRMHFKNRKDEFKEGVHFFRLVSEDFRTFKGRINEVYAPDSPYHLNKLARLITLWTKQGVARISKLIDTTEAWKLFTELERFYFEHKGKEAVEEPASVAVDDDLRREVAELKEMFATLEFTFKEMLEGSRKQLSPAEKADRLLAIALLLPPPDRQRLLHAAANLLIGKQLF